jgi:hypothetical protein
MRDTWKRTRNDDPLALVETLTTTNNSVITAILFHIWENRKSHGYKGQYTLPLADKLGKVNRNIFLYCIKESTASALHENGGKTATIPNRYEHIGSFPCRDLCHDRNNI